MTLAVSHRSGVPSLKDMTIQLGVSAARIVGDEGKLGVNRPGGGQGDPAQGVSHQERLHTRETSVAENTSSPQDTRMFIRDATYRFILIVHFHPLDGEF